MPAIIFPVGILKTQANGATSLTVPDGISIRQGLILISIPSELVALVIVNGEAKDKDYILANNDQVKIFAVVGGG